MKENFLKLICFKTSLLVPFLRLNTIQLLKKNSRNLIKNVLKKNKTFILLPDLNTLLEVDVNVINKFLKTLFGRFNYIFFCKRFTCIIWYKFIGIIKLL